MNRLGVILGLTNPIDQHAAQDITAQLEARYPGVTFTLLDQAAGHIAFTYDDGTPEPINIGSYRYPDQLLESGQ